MTGTRLNPGCLTLKPLHRFTRALPDGRRTAGTSATITEAR